MYFKVAALHNNCAPEMQTCWILYVERKIVHAYCKTSATGWTRERTDHWKVFRKMNSGFIERFRISVAENLVHFTSNINEQLGYENSQICCN